MEDRKSVEQSSYNMGRCHCRSWEIDDSAASGGSVRRLIKALEKILEDPETTPTEATKKFGDDLKDADKEYQAITDVLSKYEKFYDDLECKMAAARNWKEEINAWCKDKVDQSTSDAIKALRRDSYDLEEKDRCCKWIEYRAKLIELYDCLKQAGVKVEEATEDYAAIKGLEKTLTDRFADLKRLRDKAETLFKAEQYKSVCAVYLEFEEVFNNLSLVETWDYAVKKCNKEQYAMPGSDPKKDWPPEEFKKKLSEFLRVLILAKYQRFRWHQQLIERDTDNKTSKEACIKFRKSRQDDFILEAQDQEGKDAK